MDEISEVENNYKKTTSHCFVFCFVSSIIHTHTHTHILILTHISCVFTSGRRLESSEWFIVCFVDGGGFTGDSKWSDHHIFQNVSESAILSNCASKEEVE